MKNLIAYFSCTNTTKELAEQLASLTEGDIYKIKPVQEYTNEDLNWENTNSRSSIECEDRSIRPEIVKDLENIDQYDIIFLGFPIWWETSPNIVKTFLDTYDLEGKTVIPFATSGGSGMTRAENELKAMYPNINWIQGKCFSYHPTERELKELIERSTK